MQIAAETSTGWAKVLTEFNARRQKATEAVAQLHADRKGLALEAALGGADAQRKLAKLNEATNNLNREVENLEMAIADAEVKKAAAETAEAATAERQRLLRVAEFNRLAVEAATEFDTAAVSMTRAADRVRGLLVEREAIANSWEQKQALMLTRKGPFLAAVVHAGGKWLLEVLGSTGRPLRAQVEEALGSSDKQQAA